MFFYFFFFIKPYKKGKSLFADVMEIHYLCGVMSNRLEQFWNRWRYPLQLIAWVFSIFLVCFLLYHVNMNHNTADIKVPMSNEQRDSLMAVAIPTGTNDTLLRYDAFDVHFNSLRHIANSTAYELIIEELNGDVTRSDFMPDAHVQGCASPMDYAGSGMDRGHLVPAGDLKWSENAMAQSFLMTNICPMTKSLNEGGWAKLEEKVREWVLRDSALLVFTGPIVNESDSSITGSQITIPSHYFKIVMAPCVRPVRVIAFIYPNSHCGGALSRYAVSVDQVEHLTGLDFFYLLPTVKQQHLETTVNLDAWLN